MSEMESMMQNMQQEIRRGTLVLAVLIVLDEPQYGYSLIQSLQSRGIQVDQNTIYPLMRRIEKQGLLESVWQVEGSRPRKYYQISEKGIVVREYLLKEWKQLQKVMSNLIGGDP